MKHFVFCFLTGFAMVVCGCDDGNLTTDKEGTEKIEPGDVEDGEVTVGKEVTLKGEVTKVYDAHTFSLSDPGIDFEKDLVVVTKDALPFQAEDDATVEVKGTVEKFAVVEVEEEYGWDFDPQVEIELEDVKYYLKDATINVIEPADD